MRTQVCVSTAVGFVNTCEGESGSESGATVQMMLRRERGIIVKKEQGRITESPWMASTLGSRTVTRTASATATGGHHSGVDTGQRGTAMQASYLSNYYIPESSPQTGRTLIHHTVYIYHSVTFQPSSNLICMLRLTLQ